MATLVNSKKLFYDEWAYKIRLKMPTGYNQYIKVLLRYTKDSTVETKLKQLKKRIAEPTYNWPVIGYDDISHFKVEKMCDFIRHARKKQMLKDCRFNEYWRLVTIYTNNKQHVDDIVKDFDPIVDYIEGPANEDELEIMQTKHNTTIVDRLPYNKYRYLVKLDWYTSRYAEDSVCDQFLRWAKPFEKRIKITNRWTMGRFNTFQKFWVQDTKLLHMVQLYLGKKILKVETYKLRRELESENTNNTKNT
mgnify:FL=1|tara:strand:- start:256 stop:999 length:744 start_codon:yes stop_codon:yes gene_type:complete